MDISINEAMQFLRCRRQWDLSSPNRRNLSLKTPQTATPFYVGSLVHRILEEQVKLGELPDLEAIIADESAQLEQIYREHVGAGWSQQERAMVDEAHDTVIALMRQYFAHYGAQRPLGRDYKYLCAEVTFRVRIPGTRNYFRGTIDGIALHEPSGELWIVEHKTKADRQLNIRQLQTNLQLQGYVWAAGQLLGRPFTGALYDGIVKTIPRKPRLLQNGALSKATIVTTADVYRQTIREHDLDEADYADILAELEQQGMERFLFRHAVRFGSLQLQRFAEQLARISKEMSTRKLAIYPNFRYEGCGDCRYQDLCYAIQTGGDPDWIAAENYQQGRGWRTTRATPIQTRKQLERLLGAGQ